MTINNYPATCLVVPPTPDLRHCLPSPPSPRCPPCPGENQQEEDLRKKTNIFKYTIYNIDSSNTSLNNIISASQWRRCLPSPPQTTRLPLTPSPSPRYQRFPHFSYWQQTTIKGNSSTIADFDIFAYLCKKPQKQATNILSLLARLHKQ